MQQFLYLVRHAHASNAERDEERPLSSKGERQMDRICAAFHGKSLIAPSLVWQSSLLRAQETAARLMEGLEITAPVKTIDGLAPYDDPIEIAESIDQSDENLLVVGHEPNLSSLAAHLVSGTQTLECVVFPKASILCLGRLNIGSQVTPWQIEWHINHRLFK